MFIGRQQPAIEFPEHVEEARLIAVIDWSVDHLELHDHIDGHLNPPSHNCRGGRVHGALRSLSLMS
jgi:hypothetical protein